VSFEDVFAGKKVLVTGHTGFKGAWLSQWLLDLGAEVCGYSIDVPTHPSLFELLDLSGELIDARGDIRDLSQLSNTFADFQPQFVFHLAAQSLVRLSYDEPKTTFDTNVGGTVNVLECIRDSESVDVAVIIATDKCYENIEAPVAYKESDRLGGHDPYSASKACAEMAFISYQRSFFSKTPEKRLASARAGNVIGGGDWASDRLVPDAIRAWGNKEAVRIRSPRSIRPWQHVLEPLSGYLQLAVSLFREQSGAVGESFNFGPQADNQQSVLDLIETAQECWPGATWEDASTSKNDKKEAGILMLDWQKARTSLGWTPKLTFKKTVEQTMGWYLTHSQDPEAARNLIQGQIEEYSAL
jgi:CDP-glucose 4,6-dehydratase